jgi:HAD superfamily hydrolase (TIGR01549 family)
MKYDLIIFDLDDTLIDYDISEASAFRKTMNRLGIEPDDSLQKQFTKFSRKGWDEFGMNNTKDQYIQNNFHALYSEFMLSLFEQVRSFANIEKSSNDICNIYIDCFSGEDTLTAHADDVCRALSEGRRLAIATNGLIKVQSPRLKNIRQYFSGTFISEQVGFIKPTRNFFERLVSETGIKDPSRCLMIGDSFISDIYGASSAGMDTCWYNPRALINDTDIVPTYEISCLSELLNLEL